MSVTELKSAFAAIASHRTERTRIVSVLAISLLCILLASYSGAVRQLEQTTGLSWLFHWRQTAEPPKDLIIISINQQAAGNLGLPSHLIRWNRETYAQLIDQLTEAEADTLVFDIAFIESRPEQDKILARAIRKHGKVVLFDYMKRQQTALPNGAYIDIETPFPPPEPLRSAALDYASFTLPKFPAQIVSTQLWRNHDGHMTIGQPLLALLSYCDTYIPSLAEVINKVSNRTHLIPPSPHDYDEFAARLHQQLKTDASLYASALKEINNADHPDQLRRLLKAIYHADQHTINFYGPPGTLPTLTIDRVLQEPDRFKHRFKNKLVYIGLAETAQTEQQDAYRTAFTLATGVDLSGVEISATVLGNLLQENALTPPATGTETLALLFALLFAAVTALYFSFRTGLTMIALVVCGYAALAFWLFSRYHLWIPLLSPIIAAAFGSTCALYIKSLILKTRQHNVQSALARYLPEDIAEKLSYNVSALEQQRQLVQGVCLMTDIHGYTSVSEQLSPTELHDRLNRYYSKLIEVVSRHGGAVANIVGDSLLAVWTTDRLDKKICDAALISAREMLAILQQTADNEDSFPTSVALHCGEFSLGHLGARDHFEYSPVGDIVNTTSRIEQLNRKLNSRVLCSGPFVTICGETDMRFRGEFELKNKQKPLPIYEYCNL